MSNLSVYKGNFLDFADREFNISQNAYSKNFGQQVESLDIAASCPVGIFPSPDGNTSVEIDTDTPEDFKVFLDGNTLVIKQKNESGGNFINISGRNVVMVNGETWVNGQKVSSTSGKSLYPHKIRVYASPHFDLEANLDGCAILASKVIFGKARVKVSGVATVGIAAKSLNLSISGQGNNYAVLKGGQLDVRVSGQGEVRVKGEYSEVDSAVSGMGSVLTEGLCTGSYRASVSGMGSITHQGQIRGRVKKSLTGMGSINV